MPVNTVSAAVHLTPVVVGTFLNHGKRKAQKLKKGEPENEATDDILFDQAFNIVKAFLDMTTKSSVESTQAFMNTHIPAPPWATVVPVQIPLVTCNKAADWLIEWFGPEELKHVVGGERWWQVRGLDHLDAEWVTQKELLSPEVPASDHRRPDKKLSTEDKNILRMEDLPVMLYIHGGGYFWGSINTHRYQIIRYSRKMHGRVFAVNYRKAPQYPWPCPLHDVLAAYLYLIKPPPDALHKPIPPSQIVVAGDSAGGGLSLALLLILRDLGLPMPAGGILISPWVDLTHSFPSVMQNTAMDIIPESGFIYKPSESWPVDPVPPEGGRTVETKHSSPPMPGDADTLRPSAERVEHDRTEDAQSENQPAETQQENQADMLNGHIPGTDGEDTPKSAGSRFQSDEEAADEDVEQWEPKPPKVLMEDPNKVPLELNSQIQLYATNEQLTHPLVSPVLQSSLCNLPPLYIIGGNNEVLRDEIIHLAHRAAHPTEYPVRKGAMGGHRQKRNFKEFTEPTKVHLQIYDGMCHVLTVFTFTPSAKRAYNSIASFSKVVMAAASDAAASLELTSDTESSIRSSSSSSSSSAGSISASPGFRTSPAESNEDQGLASRLESYGPVPVERLERRNSPGTSASTSAATSISTPASTPLSEASSSTNTSHTSHQREGITDEKGNYAEFSKEAVHILCERVDVFGKTRPMEAAEEIPALQINTREVGLIKEAPARRWQAGQEDFDHKYRRLAKRVVKTRAKITAKSERLLTHAREEGLVMHADNAGNPGEAPRDTVGVIQDERRWGPLDLDGENPPPSAIAGRRDTPEAYALIKKHIWHTAPRTHRTIPKITAGHAIRAAFDPQDNPIHPPKQSASEQQVRNKMLPIHGLRMWDGIISILMRKSGHKAAHGVSALKQTAGQKVTTVASPLKSNN